MNSLEELRQKMVSHLNEQGVPAVAAWESNRRVRRDKAVVAVCLRSCEGGPAGFQDYLGEQYDEKTGKWIELYGRKAELIFGLDIWAPKQGGESGCATLFSKMTQVLSLGAPEGVRLWEVSCGETTFESQEGLFRCPAKAVGEVFLYAKADESGTLTDFIVKGTRA